MKAMEETEALLAKIGEIHDKLSDAIHTLTRSHFLRSLHKSLYSKDFHASDDDDEAAFSEARSLSAIRSALENLEDQIDFFHTFKSQQWAERAAAIARLEQSRNVLAMRLADHHGNQSEVIEEALAFVGNVKDTTHFAVLPDKSEDNQSKRPNLLVQAFVSTLCAAKKSLKLENLGSFLGHAALIAVGMLAFLHLQQAVSKDDLAVEASNTQDDSSHRRRHLHVLQARG
ncbi:hypothetical protein ACLOJK_014477 [Asimina triloba]